MAGMKPAVDSATDDTVVHDEFSAPFEVDHFAAADREFGLVGHPFLVRLDHHVDFTELACAT